MAFDFENFCQSYGIEYVTSGSNVARGHININCPFCDDDPSHHMGLDLSSSAWGCWRNSSHRGYDPSKLVARVLGVSIARARQITGTFSRANLSKFEQFVHGLRSPKAEIGGLDARTLQLLPEFRKLRNRRSRYGNYLVQRGFPSRSFNTFCEWYDLHYAEYGEFKQRILFPIWKFNRLVSWTGRSIRSDEELRYKSLASKVAPGSAMDWVSLINPKSTLYNYDSLAYDGGSVLVVCEGPIDCLKIDWYGYPEVRACCLFGIELSEQQMWDIYTVYSGFSKCVVLFDRGYISQAMKVCRQLAGVGATIAEIPGSAEDPGAMSSEDVALLKEKLLK